MDKHDAKQVWQEPVLEVWGEAETTANSAIGGSDGGGRSAVS